MAHEDSPLASFRFLLNGLQESVRGLFAERTRAPASRRALQHRRTLLGLELLCKLEEQLLLPALQPRASTPRDTGAWAAAERELQLLRDVAALVAQSAPAQLDLALAALEGMAMLHFERIAQLIDSAEDSATDWRALHREAVDLLDRWHDEVVTQGDIEDEDADPVGQAPR